MKPAGQKHLLLLCFVCIARCAFCMGKNIDSLSSTIATERWADWRKQWINEFPTASWSYFSRYSGSVAEFLTYKNAGLTMVQAPLSQYTNATAAGLKVIAASAAKTYEDRGKLAGYIAYPSPNATSTTAYNLIDEPGPAVFGQLGTAVNQIYQTDQRNAIPIITMLPNWAVTYNRFHMTYVDFVDLFIKKTNPAVMLSTHYPTLCNGSDRPEYYQNIELFRNRALAHKIGLMGFVNLTPYQKKDNAAMCYRPASESDIYWQVYSMISYGAQGIWYYNYRIGNDTQFGQGLVMHDTGKPNPQCYPYVKSVNNQLHKLAYVLMKLQSVGVFHLHIRETDVPAGALAYSKNSIPALTDVKGDNFLISEFKNQDDRNDTTIYIMLVNKRHAMATVSSALPAMVTITVNPAFNYLYKYDPETGRQIPVNNNLKQYNILLNGGHGLLLRLSKVKLAATTTK